MAVECGEDSTVQEYPKITFGVQDFNGVRPHSDDPIVILVTTSGFKVARVLVDGGSSANVIYGKCFDDLKLPPGILQEHRGTLVGFSGEQVAVRGYLNLRTTFGEKDNAKTVVLQYMVVQAQSSYNMIIGRLALKARLAALSYLHLCVKYLLQNGKVGSVQGDQVMARRCYAESVKVKSVQKGRSDPVGSMRMEKGRSDQVGSIEEEMNKGSK